MAESSNTLPPESPALGAEETTPLLSTNHGESSTQPQGAEQTENVDSTLPEPVSVAKIFKHIKRATYASLTTSSVSLVLLLATFMTGQMSPYGDYWWQVDDIISPLGLAIFLSIVLTVLNLSTILHPYPPQDNPSAAQRAFYPTPRTTFFYLPVNLFLDLLFTLFILGLAGRLSSEASLSYYCRQYEGPNTGYRLTDCLRWRLALQILCGLSIAAAAVVGLIHLILFTLRSITAFRSGLWSPPSIWAIPTTGISVQVTVKILGRDSADAVEA